MRRLRGEHGVSSTQVAILMPVLILWVMLAVQYALWFHAKQVAGAAAAEAVDAAQTPAGSAADGRRAAASFLEQSGNIESAAIAVDRSVDRVDVEISGAAPQLVPGFAWTVTASASSPVERFVPATER
jgi:Flp pilus assembly protein TadG